MAVRSLVVASLCVCFVVATAAHARAQAVQPGTWNVTPFLSGSLGDDEAGNSLGVGAGVGYDLTRNIGVEGEITRLFDLAGDSALVDWSVTTVSVNGLYHFELEREAIVPYATFGLGFERSRIELQNGGDSETSTEMAFNFGGGVKYALRQNLAVRGDLRYFGANDLAPDTWRFYAGVTFNLGR